MSDELVKFVSARLDEDAEYAGWYDEQADHEGPQLLGATGGDVGWGDFKARVTREVAAKRAILDEWEPLEWVENPHLRPDAAAEFHDSRDPEDVDRDMAWASAIDDAVRALAAVWSDHPDYRQEWKP